MNFDIEKLKAYRHIASALVRSHMSHAHRRERVVVLERMISHHRRVFVRPEGQPEYTMTLLTLEHLLSFIFAGTNVDELTHSEVKTVLRLFCDVCTVAIDDMQRDNPEHRQPVPLRFGIPFKTLFEVDGQPTDIDGIPF